MLPLANVILMPHLTVTITAFLHQSTVHPAAPICLDLMHIDACSLHFTTLTQNGSTEANDEQAGRRYFAVHSNFLINLFWVPN